MKKIMKAIPEWFLNTRFWKSIIKMRLRLYGYPRFRIENYFIIRDILRKNPDDIYCFVGSDNYAVSAWLQRRFYKFWWCHSGFAELGDDGEVYISHVRARLRRDSLLYYLKEVDNFALLKLPLNEDEKKIAKQRMAKLQDSKCLHKIRDNLHLLEQYTDPDYLEKNDRFYLYCSEYQYFVCHGLINENWKNRKRFTTDDLYNNAEVIFEE